jgi:hypothetical protein
MSDGHRLWQQMQAAGRPSQNAIVDLVVGEVTSVNPLKVKVENRELTESFLIVGALVKETHIYTDNVKKLDHRHKVPSATTQLGGAPNTHEHLIDERDTDPNYNSDGLLYHDADFDIMLWRGLKQGDIVWMLKLAQGQKYYIMQREEGVIPDDTK